ncbi:terminase [Nocardia sp. NPDC004568]|uniref:terminase n=1 Tax=Nocardia sp. NPDC004568 TaxID=3154551 RepID=UPI0033B9B684
MADIPAAPRGLRAPGKRLWKWYNEQFELSEGEIGLLREVCRTADAIDQLQLVLDRDGVLGESSQGVRVHPALPELRQQRITFARLLAALKLNEPEDDAEGLPAGRAPRGVYGIRGAVS